MDPIFDFSAAPHLPLSLRQDAHAPVRPEHLLNALAGSIPAESVRVLEHKGELYIAFAYAA